MSLVMFNPGDKQEIIQEYLEEGYQQAKPEDQENLVGKTLSLRWVPDKDGGVGGVYVISQFKDNKLWACSAPFCGSEAGKEFVLPETFYYRELSEFQKESFIPPTEKRIRATPPPSLCPEFTGKNYPITDPENSFLPRDTLQETQLYMIHDNGGRPFKVLAHQNAIEIYVDAEEPIWDEELIYNKLVACYTEFVGLWPGYDAADYSEFVKSDKNSDKNSDSEDEYEEYYYEYEYEEEEDDPDKKGEDNKGNDNNPKNTGEGVTVKHCSRAVYGQTRRADGNSLLIQLTPTEYVYVGLEIYSFETDNPIVNYYSPVGNNDVPYPVAYGEDRVYFMMDRAYVMSNQIATPRDINSAEDIYDEFYRFIKGPQKTVVKVNHNTIHERVE